nr:hypothetical protein [Kofleriaceae bacterium]
MIDAIDWLPTRELGVIERVDDESIATEFATAVLPLWPRASHYRTRARDGTPRVIPLAPLHRTSVVAGYLRRPVWLAAIVLGAPSLADPPRWGELFAVALPLAALAAILTFVIGRLPDAERARRRLLRRVVGVGAPPELLSATFAAQVRAALDDAWRDVSPRPWQQAITDGVANELLVALADYHGRHALAERARGNLEARRPPS